MIGSIQNERSVEITDERPKKIRAYLSVQPAAWYSSVEELVNANSIESFMTLRVSRDPAKIT